MLYSERQYATPGFRYRRPHPDEELTWARGCELGTGEVVLAPAALVYMNFAGTGGRERLTSPNSSGLAGGPDVPSAVLGGLYELVRAGRLRDRMAHAAGSAADRLLGCHRGRVRDPQPLRAVRDRAARLRPHDRARDSGGDGRRVRSFRVAARLRPWGSDATSTRRRRSTGPRWRSCRSAPERFARIRGPQPPDRIERYQDVRTLEDHATFAAQPEQLAEFDFLLDGAAPARLADLLDRRRGSVEADLEYCRERLEASGCTVAYVDLTLPDVEPFGVRIVRAIATGLQPIHFGWGEERLGGRRLFADAPPPRSGACRPA